MKLNLKHWRYKCEMEQDEFAEYLQINQSQISRWEHGKQIPKADSLYKVWSKLKLKFPDIHMEDLFNP